jgi:4-hydroxybenzoate polyprenyltransferase
MFGVKTSALAWLQLLRLPNVFTAVADVMMGYLVTHGDLRPAAHFSLLVAASALLYLSGMVLNDAFDTEVDARDRPHRPIPSGRVSLRAATAMGWAMLSSGVLVAWFASYVARNWHPGAVATVLAGCVVLYDGVLKNTATAPLVMGACRMLNVLLGMSLAVQHHSVPGLRALADATARQPTAGWWHTHEWFIALGVGAYVVGLTIFARTEARASSRARLLCGLVVLVAGIALLAAVPALTENRPRLVIRLNGWYLLWAVLALITARRMFLAIRQPDPQRVQAAVRHCVQSIIVLDAAVCAGYVGPYWGLAVLALLFPTIALTLWLDAT